MDATHREFVAHLEALTAADDASFPGLFEALSVEQFRTMLEVHFVGSLLVCRAAWPHFVGAGYGRIVNTVSEAMLGGILLNRLALVLSGVALVVCGHAHVLRRGDQKTLAESNRLCASTRHCCAWG